MSVPTRRLSGAALCLLAALAVLAGAAVPAAACTCLDPPPAPIAKKGAAAVFTGFPRSITSAAPDRPDQLWVTFDVSAIWKGDVTPRLSLLTPVSDALCGVDFDLDVEWLVYAYPSSNDPGAPLFTHLCTRTARAAGNPDLAALGQPIATPAVSSTWGRVKTIYRE